MKILITGGAGFVGSSLAFLFKKDHPQSNIVVLDNLKRRGSELNLPLFKETGITFQHGDIRNPSDFTSLKGTFDLMIEASAEPSVLAGTGGEQCDYLFDTNLRGTFNCLEFCRGNCKNFIFISTSRVYSIPDLLSIPLMEKPTRFTIDIDRALPIGLSENGINEDFSISRYRSLYGATKLASELLIQEYCAAFGLNTIVNRCGVITGPGQWGKTDQGVFTHWVANHYFRRSLQYTGFGGKGKQVRDLLHPDDLYGLIIKQFPIMDAHSGKLFNIGGGQENSVSLQEYTNLCREITGNSVQVGGVTESNKVDIPYYVSDNDTAVSAFQWQPEKSVRDIVSDIYTWLQENESRLIKIL